MMFPEIKPQAELDRERRWASILELIGDLLGGISLFAILIGIAFAPLLVGA